MPEYYIWYCGHCQHGPMKCGIDEHCCTCGKRKDGSATYGVASYVVASSSAHKPPAASAGEYAPFLGPGASFRAPLLQSLSHVGSTTSAYNESSAYSSSGSGPTPSTYGPAAYWWCCQCFEGPHSTANTPRCLSCQHDPCSYCKRA